MIISGGENIYSIEVERVLAEHPAVPRSPVIGVPDEKWGEVVKAVVVTGGNATDQELIAFVPRASGRLQVPEDRRHQGRAAAQPDGQDPQEGVAQAVLGGPRPRDGLGAGLASIRSNRSRERPTGVQHILDDGLAFDVRLTRVARRRTPSSRRRLRRWSGCPSSASALSRRVSRRATPAERLRVVMADGGRGRR